MRGAGKAELPSLLGVCFARTGLIKVLESTYSVLLRALVLSRLSRLCTYTREQLYKFLYNF